MTYIMGPDTCHVEVRKSCHVVVLGLTMAIGLALLARWAERQMPGRG